MMFVVHGRWKVDYPRVHTEGIEKQRQKEELSTVVQTHHLRKQVNHVVDSQLTKSQAMHMNMEPNGRR
eukprot:765202-Hanusia_phi.AAC.3